MSEYLVTGGCGFIGSHLCDALLDRGHRVRVLDDLSTGSLANIPREVALVEGDIRNPAAVAEAIAGCDGCFHLAAIASVERSNREWVETHQINLTGAIQVFAAARGAGSGGTPIPVVYASSAAIYGDQGDDPISETATAAPTSAYGADKLGCEHHARVASQIHGVPTVGLRFFNVYGPRQDPRSPYSGAISIFCDRIAAGRPVTIFGDGRQTRDFVYVADVARALMLALEHAGRRPLVLNVCTGTTTSIAQLAHSLAGAIGRKPVIETGPARDGDIRHSCGNPSAAHAALGLVAQYSLDRGLALTVRAAAAPAAAAD